VKPPRFKKRNLKGRGHEIEKRNMKFLNFLFTFLRVTFRFPGFLSNVDPVHRF
jgi:hypothetical protein